MIEKKEESYKVSVLHLFATRYEELLEVGEENGILSIDIVLDDRDHQEFARVYYSNGEISIVNLKNCIRYNILPKVE